MRSSLRDTKRKYWSPRTMHPSSRRKKISELRVEPIELRYAAPRVLKSALRWRPDVVTNDSLVSYGLNSAGKLMPDPSPLFPK